MSLTSATHRRVRHIPLRIYKNTYEGDSKLCLNCNKPIVGRRADAKYCSDECSWNFYVKNNWRLLRIKIMRRDRFACQMCGDKRSKVKINNRIRRNFNVDHKIPIFQGGKEFDESNLWTLCIACHSAKTRTELSQRARHAQVCLPAAKCSS